MKKDRLEVLCEDIKGMLDLLIKGNETFLHEIRETFQELCKKIDMNTLLLKKASAEIDSICPDFSASSVNSVARCYRACEKK